MKPAMMLLLGQLAMQVPGLLGGAQVMRESKEAKDEWKRATEPGKYAGSNWAPGSRNISQTRVKSDAAKYMSGFSGYDKIMGEKQAGPYDRLFK